jgi:hypothetical protein
MVSKNGQRIVFDPVEATFLNYSNGRMYPLETGMSIISMPYIEEPLSPELLATHTPAPTYTALLTYDPYP